MNIAPSPNPTPRSTRDDRIVSGTLSTKDSGTSPFSDLLDTPAEHSPDATPARNPPRKQDADGTDPALSILLPFMGAQAPQTLPAAPPVSEGSVSGSADGNLAETTQTAAKIAVAGGVAGEGMSEAALTAEAPDVAVANVISGEPVGYSTIAKTVSKISSAAVPASATQPSQAGLPEAGAGAEIASSAKMEVSNPVLPGAVSESGNVVLQRQSQPAPDTAATGGGGGTVAAMQQLTMKDQSTERQTRTAASVAVVSSAPGKLRGAGMPEESSEARMSDYGVTTQPIAGMTFEPQAGRGQSVNVPAAPEATVATEITRQTFDVVERIRTTGRESAEVRMHLNDGQEVTVSLRLERGEWKAIFKTDSEALCHALEQNWQRAVPQPSSQSVKFGTPVFESQSSQSDIGRNSQQHSESGGRERSFNRREQEPVFENPAPPRPSAKPALSPHLSRFSEAAAMQVYA